MALNRLPRRSDRAINFSQYYQMANDINRCNNIYFDPLSFNVIKDTSGTYVSVQPSATEQTTYPTDFAIHQIVDNHVYVYGGSIFIGDAETTCNETYITLTEEVNIIGTEYSYGGGTFIIKNFGSTFVSDSAYIRKKLYTIGYVDGTVTITRVHNPQIYPANWGSET